MPKLQAIYETDLPHRAVAVYMYFCDRSGRKDYCYPSIKTIAKDLNLSISTVKRAVADLQTQGLVDKFQRTRDNGGKSSCLYKLL